MYSSESKHETSSEVDRRTFLTSMLGAFIVVQDGCQQQVNHVLEDKEHQQKVQQFQVRRSKLLQQKENLEARRKENNPRDTEYLAVMIPRHNQNVQSYNADYAKENITEVEPLGDDVLIKED